jgi:hypothetical protein
MPRSYLSVRRGHGSHRKGKITSNERICHECGWFYDPVRSVTLTFFAPFPRGCSDSVFDSNFEQFPGLNQKRPRYCDRANGFANPRPSMTRYEESTRNTLTYLHAGRRAIVLVAKCATKTLFDPFGASLFGLASGRHKALRCCAIC